MDSNALDMEIVQEAYQSMASAFYEADGIDYTDPEEVQFLPHIWSVEGQYNLGVFFFFFFALLYSSSYVKQLELLITTLIDLDAMDGKSSVSLLAECSSSPDVSTR